MFWKKSIYNKRNKILYRTVSVTPFCKHLLLLIDVYTISILSNIFPHLSRAVQRY